MASPEELDRDGTASQFRSLIQDNEDKSRITGLSYELLSGLMMDSKLTVTIADRMLETFGRIKVILTLRNPVRFINSTYNQYAKWGLRIRGGRTLKLKDYVTIKSGFGAGLIRKIRYSDLVEIYNSRFGCENVCVLPFELLVAAPSGFLKRIQDFLDISAFPESVIISKTKNESFSLAAINLVRGLEFIHFDIHPWLRYLRVIDRTLLKKISSVPKLDYAALCQYEPAFESVLKEGNYQIWDGELSRFNYRF